MRRREWLAGLLALAPAARAQGLEGKQHLAGPCAMAGSKARLAPPGEPGEPLRIAGRLYRPDGETPAAEVIVYAYQTDRTGLYNKPGERTPRIRGWAKTGPDGRFEFETVRPGAYPGLQVPAHVHFQCWSVDVPAQWTEELQFADDPLIQAREKERSRAAGRFAWILTPVHGLVELNLRLKSRGDAFEDNILHGLSACAQKR